MTRAEVIHGQSAEVLARFPADSVDAVICDPPAWIHFMGRSWDTADGIADFRAVMAQCTRVLKPGGYCVVWALPRTSWMTAAAIDGAGIDIRDRIHHVFGSGMPHARDLSKAVDEHLLGGKAASIAARPIVGTYRVGGNALTSTAEKGGTYAVGAANSPAGELTRTTGATPEARAVDGWHTNLKPGCEDWWIGRKPLAGTLAENVLSYGTGGLNIDATRVPRTYGERPDSWKRSGHSAKPEAEKIAAPPGIGIALHPGGGWPANIVFTHSWDCEERGECSTDCPVRELDAQAGLKTSGIPTRGHTSPTRSTYGKSNVAHRSLQGFGDSGGVSRYFNVFYAGKTSTKEREAGCDALPLSSAAQNTQRAEGSDGINRPHAGAGRTGGRRNSHPTVKNLELMKFLCRLVTPAGGLIVDPYCGSGSTGAAAVQLDFDFIGIERAPCADDPTDAVAIARARIAHWAGVSR